jgi:nicotinamide-nucleotide amidase
VNVAYIAIGHELLLPGRRETNGDLLTALLFDFNMALVSRAVVPDHVETVRRQLESAGDGVVVVSGGLGPTQDDLTREALAAHLGVPLVYREELWENIRSRFSRRGMEPPEVNRRQAFLPEGTSPLSNPVGTAPGIFAAAGRQSIFCLPGVPSEFRAILDASVAPYLRDRADVRLQRSTLRLSGCFESQVEQKIQPFYESHGRDPLTILAGPGEITLHLRHADPRIFALMERELRDLVREWCFGGEGDSLEACLVDLLRRGGNTLAVGESCTGGGVQARIVRVPGASEVFRGGVVAYSNEAKMRLLGVSAGLLEAHGAVSAEAAMALAQGARRTFDAATGLGITGIAGPSGGSKEKPVGTVYAAAAADGLETVRRFRLSGDRVRIQTVAAAFALDLLWRSLA